MTAITDISPPRTVAGGRISLSGTALLAGQDVPDVRIGDDAARVVFASSARVDVLVPASASGRSPVRLGGADTGVSVSVGAVLAPEPHQAETGAIALLGMWPAFQDAADQPPRRRAGLLGPRDEPGRRPLGMRAVRPRQPKSRPRPAKSGDLMIESLPFSLAAFNLWYSAS